MRTCSFSTRQSMFEIGEVMYRGAVRRSSSVRLKLRITNIEQRGFVWVALVAAPMGAMWGCASEAQTSPSAETLPSGETTPSHTTTGTTVGPMTSGPLSTNVTATTTHDMSSRVGTNTSASAATNPTSVGSSSGVPTSGANSESGDDGSTQPNDSSSAAATSDAETTTTSAAIDTTPRPTVVAAEGTELVEVDVKSLHQTFEGWGTSLCWWANHVGGWSESARNAVVNAVVDPVLGLGYNIFRYNIGGGENPSHSHMQQYRDMPGFLTADGEWTWDADANQRAILLAINDLGSDLIFEAFSNSPPYWMTKSGCASGHSSGAENLNEDAYDAFADYLTEVVKHYRDEYGVGFRTLEPLNEPDSDWWKSNGSQEGCHFSPSNQERIIAAVAQQLTAKGLNETHVSASDENSMDDALRNLGAYSPATLDVVTQFNVHSYAGSRRTELRALANQLGKRLWQSESGPLGQNISDDTDAALFMAERIITDLRDLRAEAWLDWQAGDPGRSWASFTLNDEQQTHSPIKRFYMHAGFSRYIRPGATFVAVNDTNMVAALSKDSQYLTIVARNGDRNATQHFTFDVTSLPNVGESVSAYRVSKTEDLVPLEPIPVDGYSFVATLSPYSVTTFVVPLQ